MTATWWVWLDGDRPCATDQPGMRPPHVPVVGLAPGWASINREGMRLVWDSSYLTNTGDRLEHWATVQLRALRAARHTHTAPVFQDLGGEEGVLNWVPRQRSTPALDEVETDRQRLYKELS